MEPTHHRFDQSANGTPERSSLPGRHLRLALGHRDVRARGGNTEVITRLRFELSPLLRKLVTPPLALLQKSTMIFICVDEYKNIILFICVFCVLVAFFVSVCRESFLKGARWFFCFGASASYFVARRFSPKVRI